MTARTNTFFIANNYDKILDEKQKAFLKLVITNSNSETQTDSFAEKLSKLVEEAKINSQWRKQFMEWEREMAFQFSEGERKAKIEASIELLKEGLSPEIISKCVKVPIEDVLELQKQITVTA